MVCDTSGNVLITARAGTGKELVAKAIHYNGARKNGPFMA
jgi:two-component system response regulator AtoC